MNPPTLVIKGGWLRENAIFTLKVENRSMKKVGCLVIGSWLWLLPLFAQSVALDYYLPQAESYDPVLPPPADLLGYQVGEWHVSHDQLVHFMTRMAALSPRLSVDTIGYTYERRPLLHLVATSPANQARLPELEARHRQLSDPTASDKIDLDEVPLVVNMGYSVHGNEASGMNASLLLVYYLAAAQGEEVNQWLENMIIVIDPSLNPDGGNRFSSWVNTHRSLSQNDPHPLSREHNEAWPRGRTNHYWFDLNRDWLLLQHPESRARVAQFHRWKYNFLTDYHEMGSNSTYFFQPGIPSRNHPLTPPKVFELTEKVADFHAKALDSIGSLYYAKESFDDFYFGKGSTYPDINGGVGILFEQASSRGHLQETVNGRLSFPFTIRNQFTTSLSTLRGAFAIRQELLAHQRAFYQSALKEATGDPFQAYVFGASTDGYRARELARILIQHDIELYELQEAMTAEGHRFEAGRSYVVPLAQPQYRLIKSLFEQRTTFQDSLFYDVSAWTLPLAFDLPFAGVARNLQTERPPVTKEALAHPAGQIKGADAPYAYAFHWSPYLAGALLEEVLDAGLRARVATVPFVADGETFERGSIVVPVANQSLEPVAMKDLLSQAAGRFHVDVTGISSGLSGGVNLGSPSFDAVSHPRAVMLVGEGVSGYEAGEVWHLLDQRFEIPLSLIEVADAGRVDWDRFQTLILVNGNFRELNDVVERLRDWVKAGGRIVATKGAVNWLRGHGFLEWLDAEGEEKETPGSLPFAKERSYRGAQEVGGAIVEATLDLSHPLCYGYPEAELALFRNSRATYQLVDDPFANPIRYHAQPLLAGYLSDENQARIGGSSAARVVRLGRGTVIALADNPNFRAFWYGTNRLFINALFFGGSM
jgi:hypothetical protein